MLKKLKSRKLWVTVLTGAAAVYAPELIPLLKILAPAYVVGQAAVDATAAMKGTTPES